MNLKEVCVPLFFHSLRSGPCRKSGCPLLPSLVPFHCLKPTSHVACPVLAHNKIAIMTDDDFRRRITIESGKCGGRPCIRGHRIRVSDILDLLAHGASTAEILTDYDFLEEADIRACCWYAARQGEHIQLMAS